MTGESRQQRYKMRRKTKKIVLDLYLDDVREKRICDFLKKQSNAKQLILKLLDAHLGNIEGKDDGNDSE